jgi:hypothetical protein
VLAPLEEAATVDVGPPEGWPRAELRQRAAQADALISQLTDKIDRELIEAARSLRR